MQEFAQVPVSLLLFATHSKVRFLPDLAGGSTAFASFLILPFHGRLETLIISWRSMRWSFFHRNQKKSTIMSSEKRKADQLSEEELEQRELLASEFFTNSIKIRDFEKRVKKLRAANKVLLANHPFLANSVGALHKGAFDTPAPREKKQKIGEDTSMEEPKIAPPKDLIAGSSKGRLQKLLNTKQADVIAASKAEQAASFSASRQDKF